MAAVKRFCQIIQKQNTKSAIWVHYGLPADENGFVVSKNVAICKLCKKAVAKCGGTSNLLSHCKIHHPKEYKIAFSNKVQQQMPQATVETNDEVYDSNQELPTIKIEAVEDIEFVSEIDIDDGAESSEHQSEKDSEFVPRLQKSSSLGKSSEQNSEKDSDAESSLNQRLCILESHSTKDSEVDARLKKRKSVRNSDERDNEIEARQQKRKTVQDSEENEVESRPKQRKTFQDYDDSSVSSQDRRKSEKVSKQSNEENPIDMFFKCMAASVKALSLERQIRAKILVSQVIGNLELEEITSKYASTDSSKPSSSFLSITDPASVINDPFKK